MADLTPFDNGEFRLDITPHESDGFRVVASGLARALGFRQALDLTRGLPESEKGYELVRTPGGEQRVTYVTEAGFYRALGMRQTARIQDVAIRDQVERFQAWVYGVVLPGIRSGTIAAPSLTDDELIHRALTLTTQRVEALTERVAELAPSARAWNNLAAASGQYSVADAAKILSQDPMIKIGRGRLFDFMEEQGWIYRSRNARGGWEAYQNTVDTGRLYERPARPFLNSKTGDYELPAPTIRVTVKGLAKLQDMLGGSAMEFDADGAA